YLDLHFSLFRSLHHSYPPSFPTRRSSDLDNLRLCARYARIAAERVDHVLELVGLTDRGRNKAQKWVGQASADYSRKEMPQPPVRSEEHTSELQSRFDLVCRLLLEKKKKLL